MTELPPAHTAKAVYIQHIMHAVNLLICPCRILPLRIWAYMHAAEQGPKRLSHLDQNVLHVEHSHRAHLKHSEPQLHSKAR